MWYLVWAVTTCVIGRALYCVFLQPVDIWDKKHPSKKFRTMIVLGSGGHTAEMMRIVNVMQPQVYHPRCYVIAETDELGASKAIELEKQLVIRHSKPSETSEERVLRFHTSFSTEFIPRSREVGQSWFSTVFTTAWACLYATWTVFKERPEVVICNGPGTCIPICAAAVLLRITGLARGAIIFIESIARVEHLSLTGKILYHMRIATVFLVQWERLAARLPRARYIDRLM